MLQRSLILQITDRSDGPATKVQSTRFTGTPPGIHVDVLWHVKRSQTVYKLFNKFIYFLQNQKNNQSNCIINSLLSHCTDEILDNKVCCKITFLFYSVTFSYIVTSNTSVW